MFYLDTLAKLITVNHISPYNKVYASAVDKIASYTQMIWQIKLKFEIHVCGVLFEKLFFKQNMRRHFFF